MLSNKIAIFIKVKNILNTCKLINYTKLYMYYLMGVSSVLNFKKLTRNTYKICRGSQFNERHQNEMSITFSLSLFKIK